MIALALAAAGPARAQPVTTIAPAPQQAGRMLSPLSRPPTRRRRPSTSPTR
ncbi:hypothetical protein GT370_07785 [Acidocella sp. MX-AZ03]|uniref:hypothetical protein n=1 Tax=Acidocella sp. MX-AZ03 TaxID=2697363 RepID=UPI0022DD13E6|nr:hypothetical protein [Acidocella sp. MX-AZ03]WBO60657.1 hypothetical protein GT370_07785 [Acidocella sp. MX-AZ03]